MLSSTSGSERANAQHAIGMLLIILLICYGFVELVAGLGFTRVSRIQRRIADEYKKTLKIRLLEDGKPSVLICGNSLLLEGVDLTAIQDRLDKKYSIHRFVIEQTEYLDWYFGLRRLFHEGMQPAYVVMLLTTSHLISNATRGEYFAYYLMSPRDILDVKKEARLDMTMTSNYFLAAYSPWLGAQSEIRKWLLGRAMPDFVNLAGSLRPMYPALPSDEEIWDVVPARLTALQQICERNGSGLLLVIPPSSEDVKAALVQRCGRIKNITVLAPYWTLPPSDFEDGFHLNSIGKSLFTERLAKELPRTLRQTSLLSAARNER
jgi:hypothetical protein